jgi:AraC family transcriptional regulator, 4-hydroxyphenylacetate 3-monooxygenase operon regulatory protein
MIPDLDLASVYDRRYARDDIQYGSLTALAEIMGRSPVPHRHDAFLQIQLVEQGSFELTLDSQHFRARGPAIFTTPAGVPHGFTLSPDVKGHVLTVRQTFVRSLVDKDRSLPVWDRILPSCVEFQGAEGRRQAREMALCFRLLYREMGRSEQGGDTLCAGLAGAIIALALRAPGHAERHDIELRKDLPQYRRFLQLVEQHWRKHWPVARFAGELGVTVWRLNEISNLCGGMPPKSVLRERLAQEAKRRLTFSDVSVKEVAHEIGFSDSAYFCRFFKRIVGQTPSDYRTHVLRRPEP